MSDDKELTVKAAKERPILFQGAMVRAILAGTKTQTRRVVKPQPPEHTIAVGNWQDPPGYDPAWWAFTREGPVDRNHPFGGADIHGDPWRCPYGKVGDRLWVRETHARNANQLSDACMDTSWVYRADGEDRALDNGSPKPWTPAIHMPRAACRLVLEVTDVRVERLQSISEADAVAEGAVTEDSARRLAERRNAMAAPDVVGVDGKVHESAVAAYRALWESINGAGSWDANPWVWVVEFRRVLP